MPSASFIQNLMAKTRAQYGGRVVIGGKSYPMTTRSLEPREREYLPEGVGNAADADLRVFCVTPTDFQSTACFQSVAGLPLWPAVGSVAEWEGIRYTILAVRPGDDVIGATPMKLEIFVYKKPADDSQTTETAAEAAASGMPAQSGKRKQY